MHPVFGSLNVIFIKFSFKYAKKKRILKRIPRMEENKDKEFLKDKLENVAVSEAFVEKISYEKKNRQLFLRQKKMLDIFLKRGVILKAQHDKSLHDLIEKMGMAAEGDADAKQV